MFARRRGRQRRRTQYRVPDWVWGLVLGGIVVAAGGVYFLLFAGGSASGCSKPLPKLPGRVSVTEQGFQEEDAALGRALEYLSAGDLDNTFATFYGDVHAFTHNIDPDIRAIDEAMAKELCERVIGVEEEYDPPPPLEPSPSQMATATAALREHLRDIAEALGFERPGG